MKPKVIVLRAAGTNCDVETKIAFEKVGADAELVHINQLAKGERSFKEFHILAIPGGFTYGDDIASGKILANELKFRLKDGVEEFVEEGKLVIGICNGFQVLVKAGILPGLEQGEVEATLTFNDSGRFEDRWVYLKKETRNQPALAFANDRPGSTETRCVWIKSLPEIIYLPVAHGEGKFIPKDKKVLDRLKENGQIIFQYVDENGRLKGYPSNPNGSVENIAGICDPTGRILGLMPHPERHILGTQHPRWTREGLKKEGDGLQIFRNGVGYTKKL